MRSTFDERAGANFRAMLNDLKRTEVEAAGELGVGADLILDIVAGRQAIPQSLIERAVRVWPVNERDFHPLHDDVPDGIVVMRVRDSERSARIIERGGGPYYEYRDTAMSRVSMIRPEWIRILHGVDGVDADDPTVRWNSGHFLYQFTYFIGDVNYYYEWDGRRYCCAMNSGDSVFGLPYAKHSFATREPSPPGLILALTYGGKLGGDGQHEIAVLGSESAAAFALDGTFASLVAAAAENAGMPLHELAGAASIENDHLARLMQGHPPSPDEIGRLASAMRIAPRELMPLEADTDRGVVIVRHGDARTWMFPEDTRASYRVRRLAGSRATSFASALELDVLAAGDAAALTSSLYEYGYNHGQEPVALAWTSDGTPYETLLEPGDSFLVKPFVPHSFVRRAAGRDGARMLLLRVGGKVTGDARLEASMIGAEGLRRLARDTARWYPAQARSEERR